MAPKVITVRQDGSIGGYPTYSVALYRAVHRQKDSVPTWRLEQDLIRCHRGYVRAQREMVAAATRHQLPYCKGIRHGQVVFHTFA